MSTTARRRVRFRLLALVTVFAGLLVPASPSAAGDLRLRCRWPSPNGRVPLDIVFTGNPAVVVPPGENIALACDAGGIPGIVTVFVNGDAVREDAAIDFTAPDRPGCYYISLGLAAAGVARPAELCVVVPFKASAGRTARGWMLRADEERIGEYRQPSRSGNAKVKANPDSYQPPVWWFRITDLNRTFELSPGLAVGDLVVPSEDTGLPHTDLVPVCYPMWQAVTTLRTALAERGIPGDALKIISMFRSPPYNRGVGSNAYGRHIYGDAFDFYIDLENDGKASDLNRDGKRDRRDAYPIVALIEDLQADRRLPMGGIGVYNAVTGDHEVTMHIDMRGHRATWGYRYGAGGRRSEFSWLSKRFADLDRQDEDRARERAVKEGRKYSRPNREPLP
ncbi:MAG: hypothetical protein LIP18_03375 [Planctomycetes bacterium]|nr:hypothetical protein [Planctomycetota bacterium]